MAQPERPVKPKGVTEIQSSEGRPTKSTENSLVWFSQSFSKPQMCLIKPYHFNGAGDGLMTGLLDGYSTEGGMELHPNHNFTSEVQSNPKLIRFLYRTD